mmetsp:Transcript_65247/g.98438  ORF Transcript_65247/g.98438 Transcript_65247/m.98438 type:complete len:218 (+) Transcript_65247:476-1129(+)
MRALSGRPSVLRRIWTESTDGSKGYVRRAPPWMVIEEEMHSGEGLSTCSAMTLAANGNSSWPMLRIATVFGPRGVSMTAEKGRTWPFSLYTRILTGVLSGPCQSSMSASSGRPSVLSTTWTCSTAGERYDQVRRDPPWTRTEVPCFCSGRRVGATLPRKPCCVLGGAIGGACWLGIICMTGWAMRGAIAWGASMSAGQETRRERCIMAKGREGLSRA